MDGETRYRNEVVSRVLEKSESIECVSGMGACPIVWLREHDGHRFVAAYWPDGTASIRESDLFDIGTQLGYRTPSEAAEFLTAIKRAGGELL